jgi:hypothetical protein
LIKDANLTEFEKLAGRKISRMFCKIETGILALAKILEIGIIHSIMPPCPPKEGVNYVVNKILVKEKDKALLWRVWEAVTIMNHKKLR